MGPWLGRPFVLGVHDIGIYESECGRDVFTVSCNWILQACGF